MDYLIEDYLDSLVVTEKTLRDYENNLEKFNTFLESIGKDVKTVTNKDLRLYDEFLVKTYDLKVTSRIGAINTIKRLYKYLNVERGYIDNDPSSGLKLPRKPKREPKYLHTEDVKRLFEVVSSEKNEFLRKRNTFIVELFIFHGLRVQELTDLELNSISNKEIRIIGKGDKERVLALSNRVLRSLDEYLKVRPVGESERLITNSKGRAIEKRAIQKMIKTNLEKAGLENYSTHSLRHTSATLMKENGIDLREIQEVLGHSSITTTQIYAGVTMENKKRIASAMDNIF